ncbi:MAG: transposase, partial [Candidatus Thermoplasmatota archaeon]
NIGNKKIKRVYGDGACDMRENFNYLNSEEIEPVIKIRKNASTKARGSPARAKCLEKVKRLDKYKYGQRWAAEIFLSGVKRIFGETTKTKTKEPFTNCSTKHFLSIKI